MGDRTGIAWTDATWNPIRGCSRVSEACRHCYAERYATRFSGAGLPYEGLTRAGKWTGEVRVVERHFLDPLRWEKPRRIFVNSMSDLFHPHVTDETIDRVFAVMALAPQHTFQVLTKRPERMREYLTVGTGRYSAVLHAAEWVRELFPETNRIGISNPCAIPLPNVWLGVSVEDQATADARVPLLLQTPAAVRFVSYEPALGPVDFADLVIERSAGSETHFDALTCDVDAEDDGETAGNTLDWIIVGGESGPRARPFHVEWAGQTIADCNVAGVACFVKQLGAHAQCDMAYWDAHERELDALVDLGRRCDVDGNPARMRLPLRDRAGADPAEWPKDLRVREFPTFPATVARA